jgi:hypothetical protein
VYENVASLACAEGSAGALGAAITGPGKPGTPSSETNLRPRVGSALAASSMACEIVRSVMGHRRLLPEVGGRTKVGRTIHPSPSLSDGF